MEPRLKPKFGRSLIDFPLQQDTHTHTHTHTHRINQSFICLYKRVKTRTDTREIQAGQQGTSTDSCPNKSFAHNTEIRNRSLKLHPGPCSNVGMLRGTDRQIHTAVTNIHIASLGYASCEM